jgi:hypothetical protein
MVGNTLDGIEGGVAAEAASTKTEQAIEFESRRVVRIAGDLSTTRSSCTVIHRG